MVRTIWKSRCAGLRSILPLHTTHVLCLYVEWTLVEYYPTTIPKHSENIIFEAIGSIPALMSRCAPVKKSHPGPVGGCMTCQFLCQKKLRISLRWIHAKSYSQFLLPKSHVHNDNKAHWLASKPHESKFLDPRRLARVSWLPRISRWICAETRPGWLMTYCRNTKFMNMNSFPPTINRFATMIGWWNSHFKWVNPFNRIQLRVIHPHAPANLPRFWPLMNPPCFPIRSSWSMKSIIFLILPMFTWWLTPLSKWVITPVISGISRVNPLITGVITHLLSGMSHQVASEITHFPGKINQFRRPHRASAPQPARRMSRLPSPGPNGNDPRGCNWPSPWHHKNHHKKSHKIWGKLWSSAKWWSPLPESGRN